MGTLEQDGGKLRVLVHIRESADGTLEGTMDNLDVGWMHIPITVSTFQDFTLRFQAWRIDGLYEGKIARDGETIKGTWRMDKDATPLTLRRVQPSPIEGIWKGTLRVPGMELRLVFYIASSPDELIAAMKSCDQGDAMIPMGSVKLIGKAIIMEALAIAARFEGKVDQGGDAIEGTWNQGSLALPLTLQRIAEEEEDAGRPQDPVPPYPYGEEEVRYRNERAGCELAGTFTIPEGDGPFPAVLLIAGSGALDRDERMNRHRPFLVLADYLTRRGIAVLRADKRGVGESGGDHITATTTDFAMDAEAGVAFLETRGEVDRHRIGVLGHSEGGEIACMLAARNSTLAFIVLMAAPGVPGWILAGQQARRTAELHGLDPEAAAQHNMEVAVLLRDEKDDAILRRKLEQKLSGVAEPQRSARIQYLTLPWQREAVGMNPAEHLARVKCRVLALNGEKDVTVDAKSNLAGIREALESGGNSHFHIAELPGLNHLFQTCTTGSDTEYGQVEETLAPAAMELVAEWIRS
ncbi:conserved hypothetical protein [Candidatus Sulfopaludibacter sp. SbA3]|nr:conserved hypothetical protein [Candidatus Sulfopaludibacter sp. SbA3]